MRQSKTRAINQQPTEMVIYFFLSSTENGFCALLFFVCVLILNSCSHFISGSNQFVDTKLLNPQFLRVDFPNVISSAYGCH